MRGRHTIQLGGERGDEERQIDLRAVPQIVNESQTQALVAALNGVKASMSRLRTSPGRSNESVDFASALRSLNQRIDEKGLDSLQSPLEPDGYLARPRLMDIAATLNRVRDIGFSVR